MWIYLVYSAVALVVVSLLVFRAYVKTMHPFWSTMPIQHSYNVMHRFHAVGPITTDNLEKGKWFNANNIRTTNYRSSDKGFRSDFVKFLENRCKARSDDTTIYKLKERNVLPYLNSHNALCAISLYYLAHAASPQDVVGSISSRPVYVALNGKQIDAHYIDHLHATSEGMSDTESRNVMFELIFTHIYNTQKTNNGAHVYLFRKRGCGTPPVHGIVEYREYQFDMSKWGKETYLSQQFQIVDIDSRNFFSVRPILQGLSDQFSCTVIPSLSNILELLSTKNIAMSTLNHMDNIVALYVFRDAATTRGGRRIVECIATVNMCDDAQLFVAGFKSILMKRDCAYGNVRIMDMSHNATIINNILLKHKPLSVSDDAYFLCNFIQATVERHRTLIIH